MRRDVRRELRIARDAINAANAIIWAHATKAERGAGPWPRHARETGLMVVQLDRMLADRENGSVPFDPAPAPRCDGKGRLPGTPGFGGRVYTVCTGCEACKTAPIRNDNHDNQGDHR